MSNRDRLTLHPSSLTEDSAWDELRQPTPSPSPSFDFQAVGHYAGRYAVGLGVFSILACWLPVFGLTLALAAAVVGIISIGCSGDDKSTPVLGMSLAIFGIVFSLIVSVLTLLWPLIQS